MRLSHLFPDAGFRRLVSAVEQDATKRINNLTPTQRLVMEQMLDGHSNKIIAYRLGLSQRTIENHRAAIFERTSAKSLVDLLRLMVLADLETFEAVADGQDRESYSDEQDRESYSV